MQGKWIFSIFCLGETSENTTFCTSFSFSNFFSECFVSESFAPTKISWSMDNRTSTYRIVGEESSLRIECRIPGADANP